LYILGLDVPLERNHFIATFLSMCMKRSVMFLISILLLSLPAISEASEETCGYFESFDGTRIYWQSWNADNPSATIILIHGYGSSSDLFNAFVRDLNENGISAYALDLRGHGRSGGERLSVNSSDDYLKDLMIFVDMVMQQKKRTGYTCWARALAVT